MTSGVAVTVGKYEKEGGSGNIFPRSKRGVCKFHKLSMHEFLNSVGCIISDPSFGFLDQMFWDK